MHLLRGSLLLACLLSCEAYMNAHHGAAFQEVPKLDASDKEGKTFEARRGRRLSLMGTPSTRVTIVEGRYNEVFLRSDNFRIVFTLGEGLQSTARCVLLRSPNQVVFDFQPCTSPLFMAGRMPVDGIYVLTVFGTVLSTGAIVNATSDWIIDRHPPETTLDVPRRLTVTSAVFTFSGTDAFSIGGFECSVDNGVYFSCRSPRILTNLRPGLHSFAVRAVDRAGNADPTPPVYSWPVWSVSESSHASPQPDDDDDFGLSEPRNFGSRSIEPREHSDSDDDSNVGVILAAVLVPVTVVIICAVVICLGKRVRTQYRLHRVQKV